MPKKKKTLIELLTENTVNSKPLLDKFLSEDLIGFKFFNPNPTYDNTPAIEMKLDKGASRLVLITGENATGKSFVRRVLHALLQRESIEFMHISAEGRSMGGFQRAFLYGSEEYESTGWISCKTIISGIKTCQGRDKPHVIFYDEPDLGLSEGYSAGLGLKIKDFVQNLPDKTFAIFITTHSRTLAKQLLPCCPYHLRLGGAPDLENWLKSEVIPLNIDDLAEIQRTRFHRIQELMNKKGC